jgi:hypothetical protein
MSAEQARIERLTSEVAHRKQVLQQWRDELLKLQSEIRLFAQHYDRLVAPLEAELDAIRQNIEQLQATAAPREQVSSIWGEYSSLEERFDAKYRNGPQGPIITWQTSTPRPDDNELRTLYRRLARQHHPDLATEPEEKARRTVLMAQINAAYRAKNLKELKALELGPSRPKKPDIPSKPAAQPLTPRQQTVAELQDLVHRLDEEIDWTKIEHQRLITSPLMQLKIEASIARSRGRDLLREIAAKIRDDLNASRAELDALRRQR